MFKSAFLSTGAREAMTMVAKVPRISTGAFWICRQQRKAQKDIVTIHGLPRERQSAKFCGVGWTQHCKDLSTAGVPDIAGRKAVSTHLYHEEQCWKGLDGALTVQQLSPG